MTLSELKERINLLLTLSGDHPSYLRYLEKYQRYLVDHQPEIGIDYVNEAQRKLPAALFRQAKDKSVVLQEAINDLNVIRRAKIIQLTRLPLSSYLFARTVAVEFLQKIKPTYFVDPYDRSLLLDNNFYQQKFAKFLAVLKGSKDVYGIYSKFRKVLIIYLVNNILSPQNVAPYKKLVEYLEKEIDKINQFLALVDQSDEINLMSAFGDLPSIYEAGEITTEVLLGLMDTGISYILKMKDSKNEADQLVATNLLHLATATPGEPLHDLIYDQEHGTEIIYCRRRAEILEAQKIAQSLLNIYSPEVLLKTALNTVYEIKTYNLDYDRESVLKTTKDNLSLLQAHGIITLETLVKYEQKLENDI